MDDQAFGFLEEMDLVADQCDRRENAREAREAVGLQALDAFLSSSAGSEIVLEPGKFTKLVLAPKPR